mmetsp:Transcript_3799/g.4633  ORF Transcript_3799/g.4633 Transcript_3799/m.4633 type:complete len:232 (+) Transcript_3799:614-1309(+)
MRFSSYSLTFFAKSLCSLDCQTSFSISYQSEVWSLIPAWRISLESISIIFLMFSRAFLYVGSSVLSRLDKIVSDSTKFPQKRHSPSPSSVQIIRPQPLQLVSKLWISAWQWHISRLADLSWAIFSFFFCFCFFLASSSSLFCLSFISSHLLFLRSKSCMNFFDASVMLPFSEMLVLSCFPKVCRNSVKTLSSSAESFIMFCSMNRSIWLWLMKSTNFVMFLLAQEANAVCC